MDALQQQVWKLQKDQVALTEQLKGGQSAPPSAPSADIAEVRARLESLQHEVEVLRTRSDETEERLTSMADEIRRTRQAMETLNRPLPPAAETAPTTSPGPAAVVIPPDASSGKPSGASPGEAKPGTAAGASGIELYRLGYGDYAKGNYDQAVAELQDFIRQNPKDDLADDAEYLVGEAYFVQEKYPDAVAAYDRLLANHGQGDKAAAGHFKKGLALLSMNRTADAVIQLQYVISNYPKSEEARLARERLRALGLQER